MQFFERVNGGFILKERRPMKNPGKPIGHAFTAWKHRGGIAALRGKYWPEISWSEYGLNFFVDTGGRLKNYSTGLFCPESFEAGDNLRGVEWALM